MSQQLAFIDLQQDQTPTFTTSFILSDFPPGTFQKRKKESASKFNEKTKVKSKNPFANDRDFWVQKAHKILTHLSQAFHRCEETYWHQDNGSSYKGNTSLSGLQIKCLVHYHHGEWHTGRHGCRDGVEVCILINSQQEVNYIFTFTYVKLLKMKLAHMRQQNHSWHHKEENKKFLVRSV